MKQRHFIIFFVVGITVLAQMSFRADHRRPLDNTIEYINTEALAFSSDALTLYDLAKSTDPVNAERLEKLKSSLKTCRNQYKKIAFFFDYFFPSEAHVFNAAAVVEVEDAELEFVEPMGLQQIEKLLFDPELKHKREELLIQCESLYSSASDIRSLLYNFSATDAQLLESLRIELIRICTLYITGYDAPQLKTGIKETQTAITAIRYILQPYVLLNSVPGQKLDRLLEYAARFSSAYNDFDSFSRMKFLKLYGLPAQTSLGSFIRSLHMELNSTKYLNYNTRNIFDKNFLHRRSFEPALPGTNESVDLGKMLFSEKMLSSNNKRSCATCHRPELYFTDGLKKSSLLNAHGTLKRNAPTLLYSGLQHSEFWDGKASSLKDLIKIVLLNTEEMNGNESNIKSKVIKKPAYRRLFKKVFPIIKVDSIGLNEVAGSVAAYLQTFNLMNAAFDKYIQGDSTAMNNDQVKGFDLFMGKAKCATCHFPPLFNSLLPPYYDVSEYEIIGATGSDNLTHPKKDEDRGRFTSYPVEYYDGAFKTPTVRNAARTAPYMHNGAFRSLESVIKFYNKGGGEGIGISNKNQTLSPQALNLSQKESFQLIQFINALTDQQVVNNLNKQH